jgi:hypothetical protein
LKIKSHITSDRIDSAEQELFQILLKQHQSFNDRWYSSAIVNKVILILRVIGILGSLIGAVLCFFLVKSGGYIAGIQTELYIIFFIITFLLFYFLPLWQESLKNWTRNRSTNTCRKLAKKCVKKARKLTPFQAEYDIKGDLISYYRGQDDVWKLAWSRRLKGVAIQGQSATLFFRKWTSIQPTIVILYEGSSPLETILSHLNIEFRSIAFQK